MTIAANLLTVRARIHAACAACGRDASDVTLVAVSKFHGEGALREAYAAGQRIFGESYVQELVQKREALADLPGIQFHFIGHLQSNKVKALVQGPLACVETIHSAPLANELAKRLRGVISATAPLPVFLEINVGGEANKHGAATAEVSALVNHVRELPELSLKGLMTIPPDDEEATREAFRRLRELRDVHAPGLSLSMGMSDDLEIAIAAGATHVRVGTAIFGARTG